MTIATPYRTLAEFTADLDRIVRANTNGTVDGQAIVAQTKPHFERLLSDTSWLEPKFRVPVTGQIANYMLAKAPDNSWTVVSTVWWPGYGTPVHDHLIWGLVGVHEGIERETRYLRTDDRSRPDHAELRELETVFNRPMSISHLVPPDEDIHLIKNPDSDKPSYSIHIYGGSLDGVLRHQYDLETGEIKQFRSKYQIAC
jgi:predicted metal-dependent enzyme (double-stranded beta helix superfamily)